MCLHMWLACCALSASPSSRSATFVQPLLLGVSYGRGHWPAARHLQHSRCAFHSNATSSSLGAELVRHLSAQLLEDLESNAGQFYRDVEGEGGPEGDRHGEDDGYSPSLTPQEAEPLPGGDSPSGVLLPPIPEDAADARAQQPDEVMEHQSEQSTAEPSIPPTPTEGTSQARSRSDSQVLPDWRLSGVRVDEGWNVEFWPHTGWTSSPPPAMPYPCPQGIPSLPRPTHSLYFEVSSDPTTATPLWTLGRPTGKYTTNPPSTSKFNSKEAEAVYNVYNVQQQWQMHVLDQVQGQDIARTGGVQEAVRKAQGNLPTSQSRSGGEVFVGLWCHQDPASPSSSFEIILIMFWPQGIWTDGSQLMPWSPAGGVRAGRIPAIEPCWRGTKITLVRGWLERSTYPKKKSSKQPLHHWHPQCTWDFSCQRAASGLPSARTQKLPFFNRDRTTRTRKNWLAVCRRMSSLRATTWTSSCCSWHKSTVWSVAQLGGDDLCSKSLWRSSATGSMSSIDVSWHWTGSQTHKILTRKCLPWGYILLEVDDLLESGGPEHRSLMSRLEARLRFGKVLNLQESEGGSGYAGRRIKQHPDFSFTLQNGWLRDQSTASS